MAAADLDGSAWVCDRVSTPILADESVYGVRDLVEVIRRGAADLVNVKLAKCGGIAAARTLLELARAHGLGTVVGSMMETPRRCRRGRRPGRGVPDDGGQRPGRGLVAGEAGNRRWDPLRGPTIHLPDAAGLGVIGLGVTGWRYVPRCRPGPGQHRLGLTRRTP